MGYYKISFYDDDQYGFFEDDEEAKNWGERWFESDQFFIERIKTVKYYEISHDEDFKHGYFENEVDAILWGEKFFGTDDISVEEYRSEEEYYEKFGN